MDDFLIRALVAGLLVALVAGPLGCILVWRRMSYFGAALSHSALLGVAMGLLVGVSPSLSTLLLCFVIALLLLAMQRNPRLAADTLLGILAHASLALGLVVVALTAGTRVDLMGYLFGDILAVQPADIAWSLGGAALIFAALAGIWRPMLAVTVHEDLARVEGVPVQQVSVVFMLSLAAVIAIAMKIVGILLITSLLIIPPATARRIAATPEQMALWASLLGALAVMGGLSASWVWDLPAGPAIVVVATVFFMLSQVVPGRSN